MSYIYTCVGRIYTYITYIEHIRFPVPWLFSISDTNLGGFKWIRDGNDKAHGVHSA